MSRIRLDRMVVFDVEETCWDDIPPEGETAEIIQIGVVEVLLGEMPSIGRTSSHYVRPQWSQISPFCTALTGISAKQAGSGHPLHEVMASLSTKFGTVGKTWAAWGRDDLSIARDIIRAGRNPPAFGEFLNLGTLWGMFSGSRTPPGLQRALRDCGLQFEGTPHRALDDAFNTACVVLAMATDIRNAGRKHGHRDADQDDQRS